MQTRPSQASPAELDAVAGLLSRGRLAEAEARARSMLSANPSSGVLWKILATVLVRQDKDALDALTRASELLPQDAEAHRNLSAKLRARGRLEDALSALRKALTVDPKNPDALIDAADIQRQLGRPREAVTLYVWALQADPSRHDAHNNLGNAFLELGDAAEAARSYRRALRVRGEEPQILCNLGNALRQLGEFEEAMACSRRAIELNPTLAMAHNNLGLLLCARGDQSQAIGCFRESLRLNPRYIEALVNLGDALRNVGQRREALDAYREAVRLDPSRAASHCSLGGALLESRRPEQAADAFMAAISLDANHAAAYVGLATAFRALSLPDDAQAACSKALSIAPDRPDSLLMLGELRADRGDFKGARQSFERALEADPNFAPAHSSIASLQRMTPADAQWMEKAQAMLQQPLPLDQQIQLRFALGKYFDDTGDYERAFAHFRHGNELTKQFGGKYDPQDFAALIDRIVRDVDAAFMQSLHSSANHSERPVFIIGMPRSGTSLTEQILASHPDAFGAGEVRFWDRAFSEVEAVVRSGQHPGACVVQLADEYLKRVTHRAGDALRVTDKMPANFLYAGLISAVFPRARLIHMQRHPLDTCLSVYFQNFFNVSPYANDLDDLADYYGQYLRIMEHWRAVLPAGSLLEVPYEDLVAQPEAWTRRMLEFIGLPWDPRCLEFQRTDRVVVTASRWQVRQQIHTSSAGRWRNYEKYLSPLRHLVPD